MTNIDNNIAFSPRLVMLWNQSHLEAGFSLEDIPDPHSGPHIALYPASFINRVQHLGFTKTHDFNFRGAIYIDEVTRRNRQWVLDFAKEHFTETSFLQVTDWNARHRNFLLQRRHKILGSYDQTFKQVGFVPKEHPIYERDFFDDGYFSLMCSSKFTLCPAGDAPWSMRFYEAIMSKSLPIVECRQHTGRNALEYGIGYHYCRCEDSHIDYRADWIEENFRTFLRFQTLIDDSTEDQRVDLKPWIVNDPPSLANEIGSD